MIDRVIVTDEHHSGPNRDLLPDLLIEWNRDVPITRIQSDTLGVFEHEAHGSRSGDHSFDGHYFFTGPRVTYHVASHTVPCTRFADDILRHFGVESADDEARTSCRSQYRRRPTDRTERVTGGRRHKEERPWEPGFGRESVAGGARIAWEVCTVGGPGRPEVVGRGWD